MPTSAEQFDLLIIGAGPAGISAADAAAREGLNYLVLERGLIAHTVYQYPVGQLVFSTPDELEMREGSLRPCRDKPTREELLSHYVRFCIDEQLSIRTGEAVTRLERAARAGEEAEGFRVSTASGGDYRARRVLVAFGAMARPRRLNVAGEELAKVRYRFDEPYPYVRRDVLVVGGGNSAAEAALFLAQEGARATLAIWRTDWDNRDPKQNAIKHWVRSPLEDELARGRLRLLFFKEVTEITPRHVHLRQDDGATVTVPNDALFILIGSDPDLTLLRDIGVELHTNGLTQVPAYDPDTHETNIPGLYVAGHFTHARHIKQAIAIPRRIVPLIAQSLRTTV